MSDPIDEDSSQEEAPQHEPVHDRPAEQPERARRRLRLRGRRAGIIIAILVLAAAATVVIVTGSGGAQIQPASARATTEAQRIDALLAGIPQSDDALGSPNAPVTLQYFGDLECPTSRAFTLATLPSLIGQWVRSGQLRIEYRSLETATREPAVFTSQQAAALAAGMQDKAWYYIELFYHEQGREDSRYVTNSYLDGLADQTPGLNFKQWSKNRREPPLAAQVATDEQTAARLGFHNTPAFLIGPTGSRRLEKLLHFSVLEPAAFNAAIERALTKRSGSHSSLADYSGAAHRLALGDSIASTPALRQESAPC